MVWSLDFPGSLPTLTDNTAKNGLALSFCSFLFTSIVSGFSTEPLNIKYVFDRLLIISHQLKTHIEKWDQENCWPFSSLGVSWTAHVRSRSVVAICRLRYSYFSQFTKFQFLFKNRLATFTTNRTTRLTCFIRSAFGSFFGRVSSAMPLQWTTTFTTRYTTLCISGWFSTGDVSQSLHYIFGGLARKRVTLFQRATFLNLYTTSCPISYRATFPTTHTAHLMTMTRSPTRIDAAGSLSLSLADFSRRGSSMICTPAS